MAFSAVFGLPLNELVADPSGLLPQQFYDIQERLNIAAAAIQDAETALGERVAAYTDVMAEYSAFFEAHPEVAMEVVSNSGSKEQIEAALEVAKVEFAEARSEAEAKATALLRTATDALPIARVRAPENPTKAAARG